jgi:hypothetical protein
MDDRKQLRSRMLSSLYDITQSMDVSSDAVVSWISTLRSVCNSVDELSEDMVDTILDILDYILYSAESLNLSYETVQGVLDVVSSITKIDSKSTLSTMSHAKALYNSFANFAANDMVGGQSGIQTVSNNIRFSTTVAFVRSGISSSTALSPLEQYLDVQPQSISFAGTSDSSDSDYISVTIIETPSSLADINSSRLLSNPMTIVLGGSPCTSDSENACYADVVLRLNNDLSSKSYEEPVEVTTECMSGEMTTRTAVCPYGSDIPVVCEGSHGFVQTICPVEKYAAVCANLNGGLSNCSVSSNTSSSVTCRCLISPVSSSDIRRVRRHRFRQLNTDNDDNNQDPSTTSSVEFGAMLETTLSSFVQTWSSADDLTLSSVAQSWDVLVTIGTISAMAVMGLMMSTYADNRDIHIESDTKIAEKAISQVSLTQRSQNRKSKRAVKLSADMKMIEDSLPNAFSSKPFSIRYLEDMKKYHRWFGVIFHYCKYFSRPLRVLSITVSVVSMLFMQAVTYNVAEPNDGSCESQVTEMSCLAEKSTLARNANKCYWDATEEQCYFLEPVNDIMRVVFVALLSAIASAPISFTVQWLIMNVLAGQTIDKNKVSDVTSPDTFDMDKAEAVFNYNQQQTVLNCSEFKMNVTAECKKLNADLLQYRNSLSTAEMAEFDGMIFVLYNSFFCEISNHYI